MCNINYVWKLVDARKRKKRKNENIRMIKIKILIVNKDYKILSQDSKSSQQYD